ncbi:hypothetical protein EXIGLDRAFT_726473 [Exidia glandulosa HHB12029]|uniref:Uncharacterized protein n=1 Tax=Exidia glandulosa HHB12029 TaxID=1314781 RepID=A0A165MA85_EXIGL|nr:hypothetical protein EXIGLDRAFT_726471 [Exidia glandulosa HHB12029]KZV98987.1 hypothetical protein EXIGLDRAFT_726473 [Exidia glandulosa HHB12029]
MAPTQERSRNPRREQLRLEKLNALARLKRVKLTIKEPPPPSATTPTPTPTPATPLPALLQTPAPQKRRPGRPRRNPVIAPALAPPTPAATVALLLPPPPPTLVPITNNTSVLVKDMSQTPVELSGSPPSNVNPAKAVAVADEGFFSVEDARGVALSPLTAHTPSEPAMVDSDPDR